LYAGINTAILKLGGLLKSSSGCLSLPATAMITKYTTGIARKINRH
jgi:hypothetical protein